MKNSSHDKEVIRWPLLLAPFPYLSWQAYVRSAEPTGPRSSGLRQPGVARRGHPDRGRHLPAQRLYGRRRESPTRLAAPPPPGSTPSRSSCLDTNRTLPPSLFQSGAKPSWQYIWPPSRDMSQYLLRACLVAGMILVSCGFGAIALTAETAAQVPGVWGGPGVAPPSTPAPPTPPSSSRPLDPRAFYPPPYGPPSNLYPRARFWAPGYYDAYGNWVFGYYRYQC